MGGFAGKTLFVDLSKGTFEERQLPDELYRRYLGGLGLCIRLACDAIAPTAEPLSPENAVVIGAGPLVGTDAPASSRVYAVSRLAQSRTMGWCGAGGGRFGALLKYAGYDHVVITGRAAKPVYLKITQSAISLEDAAGLWGKGAHQTTEILGRTPCGPWGVVAIGQAGENLVPYSMAFLDKASTLGRGGLGAVLGSKNLKAVIASGRKGLAVADKKAYRAVLRPLMNSIREYPHLAEWQELGLLKSLPVVEKEVYLAHKKRRIACVSCPVGDKDVMEFPGAETICSTSAANLFLPIIYGVKDPVQAARVIALLDDLGLDLYEFFGALVFGARLVDARILDLAGGPPIKVDSAESLAAWAKKIALRQGAGNLLAGGVAGLKDAFGEKAGDICPPTVKGMYPYVGPGAPLPWNLFGTMELGQALDPRGPHVAASGSPTYFARRPLSVFPKHLARMGVPEEALPRILGPDNNSLSVGRLLKYSHAWFATLGSLGVCARAQINRFYSHKLCAQIYEAATGIKTSQEDLRRRADRVWTLLALANAGETGASDGKAFQPPKGGPGPDLPTQWFGPAGFKNYLTDEPLTRDEALTMMADYHSEQGWDPVTGTPLPECLKALGLDSSGKDLE